MQNNTNLKALTHLKYFYYMAIAIQVIIFFFGFFYAHKNMSRINLNSNISLISGYLIPILVIAIIPLSYKIYAIFIQKNNVNTSIQISYSLYSKVKKIQLLLFFSILTFNNIALFVLYEKKYNYLFLIILIFSILNIPRFAQFENDFLKSEHKNSTTGTLN